MMDGLVPPEGAGGGGGGSSQQGGTEAPNTLRSRMTARVLYLVSEGVIGGLQDGLKSVFLNDTPIQAPDGSYNFITEVYERVGQVSQAHVDGFPSAEATFSGPGLVRKAEPPPVRTINMTGRDRFSVTILVRALFLADGAGNIGPNTVALRIQWRVGAGGWNTIWENTISGKCVAPYPKQLFFPVPHNGSVDVRVERLTNDPADSKTASEFEWSAFSAITDQKMIYPGAAYYAIKFDAERFPGGIPTATFDLNGMLAEVPSNYNPTNRTYSGVWDGTFVQAYTDNPAWWFWTLATNPTYGAGTALSAGIVSPSSAYAAASGLVDRWVLYSIAQYCDETVPDGLGGFEPRYTINLWLNTAEEAYRVLNAIASIFRGMLYWGRGQIVPVIDRPSDPVKLVTPANVVEGLFRYESTALRSRHSVVRVRWRDPAQGFREAVEVVEDAALMAEVGYRVIDYEAIGCTKRSMARRMGRWILYTEKYESGTVAYAASADHITAMPGDVILVQDPGLAGVAFSGRLALPPAAGATSFTLDREVTFTGGITYTLRLVMENGAISAALPITTGASTTRVVTTSAAPSAAVMAQAVWIISASNVAPVPYRVLAVEEAEEDQIFNVLALRHFPGKYGFIENGLNLNDEPFSILQDPYRALTPPSDLAVQEYLSGVGSTALVRVVFSWTPASNDNRVRAYEAEALQPGVIIQTAATPGSTVTFLDLVPGAYTFRVRSTGQNGQLGAWVTTATINVDGISDPPGPPTAVAINSGIRQLTLTWTLPTGRFLRGVEVWAAGLGFNNAATTPFASLPAPPSIGAFTKIGEAAGTSFTHNGLLPSHVWYYYLRSIDTFGSVGAWVGPIGARTSYLVAADIQDGIINTAKFAANIAPVNLIPNLTASGTENAVAFNTGDAKLYKRTAGAWVPMVRAADFAGQIKTTQIEDNAITTDKIVANSVVFGKVAAGAIKAEQIVSGELKAIHMASETILTQTAQIGNGIITNAKIGLAEIDELRIAGDAITTYGQANFYNSSGWMANPLVLETTFWSPSARPCLCFGLNYGTTTEDMVGDGSSIFTRVVTYVWLNGNLIFILQYNKDWVATNMVAGTNTITTHSYRTNSGGAVLNGVQCTILGRAR